MTEITTISESGPLLVFGGPYSNLEATIAMRRLAKELGIAAGNTICTGDVIAYAADPEETADLVRSWGIHVVAGNCEEQIAAGAEDCGCGFEPGSECDRLSRGWYPYANARVTPQTRAWMAGLPSHLTFSYQGLAFHTLHAGTRANNRFLFASDSEALAEETARIEADIVLAGHAGLPFIARVGETSWVNAGVIGVPANDGTPDGWFAVITPDADGIRIALRRLAYDYLTAAASMRRSGHANEYARAIVTGVWPSHDVLPDAERAQTGIKLRQRTTRIRRGISKAA